MHGAKRSATVTCKNDVELLAVGREDFVDIFMHVEKDREPDHIRYLRQAEVLQGWPVDLVPWDDPKVCLVTYFRSDPSPSGKVVAALDNIMHGWNRSTLMPLATYEMKCIVHNWVTIQQVQVSNTIMNQK